MANVISYSFESCKQCMRCVRACPTEAIHLDRGHAAINEERCILCDRCLSACKTRGLKAASASLDTLGEFDYRVLMVPTSLLSDTDSLADYRKTLWALKKLGFDEVIDLSPVDGALYHLARKYADEPGNHYVITSVCPAIRRLIEVKYPLLLDAILPFRDASEIMARVLRKRYGSSKGRLGIYNLCECAAKLGMARYPGGNQDSEIDYGVTIASIFPAINHLKDAHELDTPLCKEGILSQVQDLYNRGRPENDVLTVDGLYKVQQVLELAEFERLPDIRLLALYACPNGCIGGRFLWGDPYVGRIRIERFLPFATGTPLELAEADILAEGRRTAPADDSSIQDQVRHFTEVNKALEILPGFDCGACGFPSCRAMAEEIVAGHTSWKDCRILGRKEDTEK